MLMTNALPFIANPSKVKDLGYVFGRRLELSLTCLVPEARDGAGEGSVANPLADLGADTLRWNIRSVSRLCIAVCDHVAEIWTTGESALLSMICNVRRREDQGKDAIIPDLMSVGTKKSLKSAGASVVTMGFEQLWSQISCQATVCAPTQPMWSLRGSQMFENWGCGFPAYRKVHCFSYFRHFLAL